MHLRIPIGLLLICFAFAKAQQLTVHVEGIQHELKSNAENSIEIMSFNGKKAPAEYRLNWLNQQAIQDIQLALQPFGYYHSQVQASLLPSPTGWLASYQVDAGKPTSIRHIQLQLQGAGARDSVLLDIINHSRLKTDARFIHADYQSLKTKLSEAAIERGYFFAHYTTQQVWVDLDQFSADIALVFDTGQRAKLGTIKYNGSYINTNLLDQYTTLRSGDDYLASTLLTAQSNLISTDYFTDVTINASPEQAQAAHPVIPVDIALSMQKQRVYSAGVGYGTDMGARIRGGVDWRYLNPQGHTLNLEGILAQFKQNLTVEYKVPAQQPLTHYWSGHIGLERENTRSKDSTSALIGVTWHGKDGKITQHHSLDYRYDYFDDGSSQKNDTRLLVPSANWTWQSHDNPQFTDLGVRFNLMLRGSSSYLLSDIGFVQSALRSKLLLPLTPNNRLILRADVGTTWVSGETAFTRLPTSLRFYAGGDNSIRGYGLDSIGPTNAYGRVVGGRHLLAGSLEYEYQFKPSWRAAAFIDAGDAFDDLDFNPKWGAGLGVRWASPVGAIRFDLAHGFNERGDNLRLHLTLGSDF